MIGRAISVLVPPELQGEERRRRAEVVDKQTASPKFRTVRRRDGTRIPIELVISPLIVGGRVEGATHLSYPLSAEESPR